MESMITGLIRILIYSLLFYLIFRLVRFFSNIGRLSSSTSAPRAEKRPSGTMVKDEVCNTYLPREDAIRLVYKGKEYFFCSEECKRKFLQTH